MKVLKWLAAVIIVLALVYFLGPKGENPVLTTAPAMVSSDLKYLEDSINQAESALTSIKQGNHARIIWADSSEYKKTPYSIVYLHGFSASHEEGSPLHTEIARRYGCNLFLTRLEGHGITEEEPMLHLTVDGLVNSAKQSLAIAKQLGKKVILLTTSTGGTLGLYLAQNDPDIAAIILYSPNIDIFDPAAKLLSKPWGLQIARMVVGGDYNQWELDSGRANFWTNKYRLEAAVQLRILLDATMTKETFEHINQPTFLGYYYKSDAAMDSTVSVVAMKEMFHQLGTPDDKKREVAFPNVGHHVIASHFTSKDLSSVRSETFAFLEEIVGLLPVHQN
ncbi:alpha/beta hydrolase [Fulvivirga sp. M361]|uniref:alpha/beta hydrolase n=1 Tax=Fulvivirga sp. M361 TaxID=2594266 RepID=UPI001179C8B0|nr:alpha/beta fold hydrolase [Fulvivirga sp. M361]TRX58384.1 alpha/beta hydrolase [Fulvivirga sp. M361]